MEINSYEILFKQMKKYKSHGAIVSFIGVLLAVLGIVWSFIISNIIGIEEVSDYGVYGMFFLLFGGYLIFILGIFISNKAEPLKIAYVNEYRSDIVTKTLDDIFDSVAYNSGSGFSREYIEDMDLLKFPVTTNGNFSSGNYIHASYKGISWKYGDIRIWENQGGGHLPGHPEAFLVRLVLQISRKITNQGDARTHVFFNGRVLEIDYPILCTTRLKIYSYTFTSVKGGWTSSKREKRQETGDGIFDRKFLVKCNSDVDFRNVVTPEMKEKLELFHNLYSEFAIEIEQGKLYVLVARAGESFMPDYRQEMDVAHEKGRIKREMQVITDAIDIFCRKLR